MHSSQEKIKKAAIEMLDKRQSKPDTEDAIRPPTSPCESQVLSGDQKLLQKDSNGVVDVVPSPVVAEPEVSVSLSKAQRKRLKKQKIKAAKSAERAKRPKRAVQELPLSSVIVLPKTSAMASTLDTDEKRLAAARERLAELYSHVLKIQPIPRPCPVGLLKDLCPLAVNIRIPDKSGARYAFLQFRNAHELDMAQKLLATKSLNGKPIRTAISSSTPRPDQQNWRTPESRELSDFRWNTLFLAHLPRSTTRLDLGQVFRKARDIRLATSDDGSCKGTCLLTFKSLRDALQAFETRHRTFIRGTPIYVNFALKQATKSQLCEPISNNPSPCDQSDPVECPSTMEVDVKTVSSSEVPSTPASADDNVDFVIDRVPSQKHKKKGATATTNDRIQEAPKLLHKYQLKRKGTPSKSGPLCALDALLRPPTASKPKHAKKSRRLTKRGKPSKHR